jgi:hypothetical protein
LSAASGRPLWRQLATPAVIGASYVVFMVVMWLIVRDTTMQMDPPA